jgi:uncharacterized protein YbbK (DUF523 family)
MGDKVPGPPSEGQILVSACLAGRQCRFDGSANPDDFIAKLVAEGRAVLICPEVDGGLRTPRPRAELAGGSGSDVIAGRAAVITDGGEDVTGAYLKGAERALARARATGATAAILKARSPSCGVGEVYDGSFSRTLVEGDGVTAALLRAEGLSVLTEKDLEPQG